MVIIDALDSVTRRENETWENFLVRAKINEIGRKVKIIDMRDNSDLFRMKDVEEKHLRLVKKCHLMG